MQRLAGVPLLFVPSLLLVLTSHRTVQRLLVRTPDLTGRTLLLLVPMPPHRVRQHRLFTLAAEAEGVRRAVVDTPSQAATTNRC